MQRGPASQIQSWLIIFLLGLAVVLGLIILLLVRDRAAQQRTGLDPAPPEALRSQQAGPGDTIAQEQQSTPAASIGPTPTFVPVNPPATSNEAAHPAPIVQPTSGPAVVPPTLPSTPQPQQTAAPAPVQAQVTAIRLDDEVWRGSYRSTRGYGGRSATWIYGVGTQYSSMQAVFSVDRAATGQAVLSIEGMDSEDRAKTPIQILINGVEIFNGPNPLPNDDLPLESGTWASYEFPFDAALLRVGDNLIQINNLKPGSFSLPPFFMLDYAIITFEVAAGANT